MKQIVSFNIARLRVEEDFGFLKLIATETDNLPKNGEEDRPGELSMTASVPTTLTTSVTTFKNAVDAFDNALKDSASTPSTALAAEADSARDNAWRGANNYLKAMTAHPANDVFPFVPPKSGRVITSPGLPVTFSGAAVLLPFALKVTVTWFADLYQR